MLFEKASFFEKYFFRHTRFVCFIHPESLCLPGLSAQAGSADRLSELLSRNEAR